MKILLYAIFTNEYKKLIPLWIEHTASKFFPKESDVIIFTDDTSVIKETDILLTSPLIKRNLASLLMFLILIVQRFSEFLWQK